MNGYVIFGGGPIPKKSVIITGIALLLVLHLTLPLIDIPIPINEYEVNAETSNSGIQILEDVADISFTGIYNGGDQSGFGSLLDLKDINGDGYDDIVFPYGLLPGNAGMIAFSGGESHINGSIDLSSADPDHSYPIYGTTSFDVGDIDGDGDLDMAMARYKGSGRIYMRDGDSLNPYRSFLGGGPEFPNNYQYDDHLIIEDLDKDGLVEVISGYFFNDPIIPSPPPHSVNIQWGTGEETTITQNDFKMLGSAIETGDIDGDGNTDLIIGANNWDDDGRDIDLTGSVFLIFNASSLKNESTIDPRDAARCWIRGSSERDYLGFSIQVIDIDQDGKDDIIAGSPGSDDPLNMEYDCGALHVFYGDIPESFPSTMESNAGADLVIYGATGRVSGDPDYSGDRLGRMFEIADIDGDSEQELIVSAAGKHMGGNGLPVVRSAGVVTVHETADAFPSNGKLVKLDYPSKVFTVEGTDPSDSTGWQLETGDVNGDGVYDLMISVPGGDGTDNFRPECGEVYVIMGQNLRVNDLILSGEGFHDGCILPGSGPLRMNLSYTHTKGWGEVKEVILSLDPDGSMINISIDPSSARIDGDDRGSIEVIDSFLGGTANIGWSMIDLNIGWDIPIKGPLDIIVELIDSEGNSITSVFNEISNVEKDVLLGSNWKIEGIDEEIRHRWDWCSGNADLMITNLNLVHLKYPEIKIQPGDIGIGVISSSGGSIDNIFSDDEDLFFDALDLETGEIILTPSLNESVFPPAYPAGFLPGFHGAEKIEIRVDKEKPLPPNDVTFKQGSLGSGNIISGEGTIIAINATISEDMDPEGSGVHSIEMEINEGGFHPVMAQGGLFGTYWQRSDFKVIGEEMIDPCIDFNWNDGFGPYDKNVPSNDFSIRWHGWIRNPWDYPISFKLTGKSIARLELDGQEIIPWTSIEGGPTSSELDLEPDTYHSIVVHYFFHEPTNPFPLSGIDLQWSDDGRFTTIDENHLFYPTNESIFDLDTSLERIEINARLVDWVGRSSDVINNFGRMDTEGPVFYPIQVPEWTTSLVPRVVVDIMDRATDLGVGAGVDPGSVHYRLIDRFGNIGDWTIPTDNVKLDNKVTTVCYPILHPDWKGDIQFEASDIIGNPSISNLFRLNVDIDGPEIEVMGGPDLFLPPDGPFMISARIKDMGGSGVDGDSVEIKIKEGNNDWSDWSDFGSGTDGHDIIVNGSLLLAEGSYYLQLRAFDIVGNIGTSMEHLISISIAIFDLPPVPFILSPENGSEFSMYSPILLDSTGTTYDPDENKELSITWWSNITGYIISGGKVITYLPVGHHKITLTVDDGIPGQNVSTSVSIIVFDPDDDGDGGGGSGRDPIPEDKDDDITWMVLLASLIGTLVVIVVLYMIIRSRKENELVIGLRDGPQDDTDDDWLD